MSSQPQSKSAPFLLRHSVAAYFLLAFTISWLGALAVAAPPLLRHEPLPKITGILMFPAMLLGPSLSGLVLTGIVAGKAGLRDLFSKLLRASIGARWYVALLIPPALILILLFTLKTFYSPVYTPNFFLMGGLRAARGGDFGDGFAFPKMSVHHNPPGASISSDFSGVYGTSRWLTTSEPLHPTEHTGYHFSWRSPSL
jgi:uncharacterized protein